MYYDCDMWYYSCDSGRVACLEGAKPRLGNTVVILYRRAAVRVYMVLLAPLSGRSASHAAPRRPASVFVRAAIAPLLRLRRVDAPPRLPALPSVAPR